MDKFPDLYSENNINKVLDKIQVFSSQLRSEFEKYIDTRKIPTRQIDGYSIKRLMKEHSMNEIAAFLTLDWLEREPEKAKTSLKKGYDQIKD